MVSKETRLLEKQKREIIATTPSMITEERLRRTAAPLIQVRAQQHTHATKTKLIMQDMTEMTKDTPLVMTVYSHEGNSIDMVTEMTDLHEHQTTGEMAEKERTERMFMVN